MRPRLCSRHSWNTQRRRPSSANHSRHRPGRRWWLIVLAMILLFVALDWHLRPLMSSYGVNQATLTATQVIHEAVTDILTREEISYQDLVQLDKNETGDIRAVEANIVRVNQMKSAITTEVSKRLSDHKRVDIQIPLGTLIGGSFLSGRGPRIPIRVSMNGAVLATIHSSFSDAGINQTAHQITLELKAPMVLALPGNTVPVEVHTSFVIAETILVGEVPDSFTEVDGSQAGILGQILAYGGKNTAQE